MKYNLYSEVPFSELRLMKGSDIKWISKRDHKSVYIIKDNKEDHKVYRPNEELEDETEYYVYEDEYMAGSGICYGKMFIYIDAIKRKYTVSRKQIADVFNIPIEKLIIED